MGPRARMVGAGFLLAGFLPLPAFAQAELTGTYVGYVGTRANGTMINAANRSMNYSESGAAPFSCDLYFPGSPVEEFTIEATGSLTFSASNTNSATAITTLSGPTVVGRTIVWSGQYTNGANAIRVDQTLEMESTDRHVSATVVLTNTGTTALTDVYYLRNGDPDFGQCLIGGTFNTFNDVVFQPPVGDRALVIMRAGSTPEMALGLGAFDARARVNASGFNNTNASGTWNAPVDPDDATGDIGVAIVFKEPSLPIGASTTFRFTYNWALDNATVISRFDVLGAVRLLKPFDFARLPATTPQVQMLKKDPQGDRVRYELQWSSDPTFATFTMVNSSNGGFVNLVTPADVDPFLSSQQVAYTFAPPLTSGTTYWWRARSNDPTGSNVYTSFSASRSFTVDTGSADTAWLLKTTAQMQRGAATNTAVGADLVALANIVQPTAAFAPSTDSGTWTNGPGAYANGGTAASQTTVNSTHDFATFNVATLHPGSTITGIEVRTDGWNSGTGTGQLGIQLSWDAGTTWTTQQVTGTLPAVEATQILGGSSDLWGRAGWLESELTNANFRVRVESERTGGAGPAWNLDFLQVIVHYLNHVPPVFLIQATGAFAPSTDAGSWTGASDAYSDGGAAATCGTSANLTHAFGTFDVAPLPPGSTITGIVVSTDGWDSGDRNGRLGIELSWDGGTTWTVQRRTGYLRAAEATQTVGNPTDLWGRAGWLESELSNANFQVRVVSRVLGGEGGFSGIGGGRTWLAGPSTWNLDFVRVTIHYQDNVTYGPSGTYLTPELRNSFLTMANGGVSWSRIVWSKNLPAGCSPPACDVSLDVLDRSGIAIPGYTGFFTSPISITGINPATYPGIRLRANLFAASPSPQLLSASVDTVGGTPLEAEVGGFHARWISDKDVRVAWGTDATSDALSFDLLRSADPDGDPDVAFAPVAGSPIDASLDAAFQDYEIVDRPGVEADVWYVLDVHGANGSVTRLGPVEAKREAPSGGRGWGCSAGARPGSPAPVLALVAAIAATAFGFIRRRHRG